MSRTVSMQFGKPGSLERGGETSGGITISQIWVNPSPTANFGAQTVTLDLSGYNAVIIWALNFNYGNEPYHSTQFFIISDDTWALQNGSENGRNCVRAFTFTSSGISFSNGRYNSAASNQVLIPQKIYGVKF